MTVLSEWLQLMLAEIARKREELERARAEDARRSAERDSEQPGEDAAQVPAALSHERR